MTKEEARKKIKELKPFAVIDKELFDELEKWHGMAAKYEKKTEWVNPTLKRADEIINGERQDQYGDPEDSFLPIAVVWQWYLDYRKPGPLTAVDTAIMLALMKISRMFGQKWHRDNAIDVCGYMGILNDRIMGGENVQYPKSGE